MFHKFSNLKKISGFIFCLAGTLGILLVSFSDLLRGRPFSFGPVQIGLLVISVAILGSGLYLLRDLLITPLASKLNIAARKIFHLKPTVPDQPPLALTNPFMFFLLIWGFCVFLSAIFLLICSRSSPLYPLNDWVDANAFFTMGKGMMNGKILYRDLFDHKGPLLYFLHGLAYLISNRSFFGVYLLEVLSLSFFLYYSFKITSLFVNYRYSLIALPLLTASVLNLKSFSAGDSAEEFCLPLLAISLYFLIHYLKKVYPDPLPARSFLFNGFIAGCVLWIKFSMLGFWIGWMVSLLICMLVRKQYLPALKDILFLLSGIGIATLPWLLYFGINHSISTWMYNYIFINATIYPKTTSFIGIFNDTYSNLRQQAFQNPLFSGLLWLGLTVFTTNKHFLEKSLHRFCLLISVLFLALGVYGGGLGFPYYFLILSPLVIFGMITLLSLYARQNDEIIKLRSSIWMILISLIIAIPFTLRFNQNVDWLKLKKQDLVQYKFAALIVQSKNPTLLNYGFLDGGFFTVTGITPNVRFFQKDNFTYHQLPIMMDEQNRYIKEKAVEYIVIRRKVTESITNLDIPKLYENYQQIALDEQEFGGTQFYYLLFKSNP